MNTFENHDHNLYSVGMTNMPASKCPDLMSIGQDIYRHLNPQAEKEQDWKKRLPVVEIIRPHHLYSPKEVAAVLSVSYETAVRTMVRMKRSVNLAKPRAKKRLLRVKGSDLLDYINGKLNN